MVIWVIRDYKTEFKAEFPDCSRTTSQFQVQSYKPPIKML